MMSVGARGEAAQFGRNRGDSVSSSPASCQDLPPGRLSGKTLIIGLGNPLISDDSVGLRVARRLRDVLRHRNDIEVTEDYWGGLRLMERMIGFDRAIVIDAICSGAAPGTIPHLTTSMI